MYAASKIKQLSLSETNFRGVPEAPTTPGVYWFHREIGSRAILVEVRVTNGAIPPSSGTDSRQPFDYGKLIAPFLSTRCAFLSYTSEWASCEAPMPFLIRPFRRFSVQCPVTFSAGP